jgi:uncharacterized membrane protein YgdD (TMEM256/DUF423 family)
MSLELELVCFFVVFAAILATSWYIGSTGLAITYLLSLGYIHCWGGLIHALSWYHGGDPEFTRLGFEQFTYAVTVFGAAYCSTAFLIQKRMRARLPSVSPARIAPMCLFIGALLYGVLRGLLSGVPSIGALTTCGGAVFVAGLCLLAWEALRERRYSKLVAVLASLAFLPFFTIVSDGFLGYGAAAALVVIAFVTCSFRPRLVALLFLLTTVYLGSCIFMTYMRDRDDIRYEVWEEASPIGQRIDRLKTTFTHLDLVNLSDEDQLDRIEGRLNQNDLVGRAVSNLEGGDIPFAEGETFRQALISLVPRIFWPAKPVTAGSPDIVSYFTGLYFAQGTSVGIGQVMEGYVNFGTAGVIGVFLVFGLALGIVDSVAAHKLQMGDTLGFLTWFVPGIAFLQPGGSLVEVVATTAASVVLVWLLRIPLEMRAHRSRANIDQLPSNVWGGSTVRPAK